ncbi:MAG TPA: GlsB/YeaQ/YmgE family stress response membrane protein [Caulobacteraceae bacterium]|nr:GlsB/YeaQ/YmgE family stress response membrane protein [Caulobacteraceae bacterium]
MDSHSIIAWLIIGAIAGWLAGVLVKGGGFGLVGDIVVGIIGAFIGGWLAGVLHIHIGTGWISSIITAAVGAALLLFILRAVRMRRI